MLEIRRNAAPPATPANIATRCFFDEVLLDWVGEPGVGRAEGDSEPFLSGEAGFGAGAGANAGAAERGSGDGAGVSGKSAARL